MTSIDVYPSQLLLSLSHCSEFRGGRAGIARERRKASAPSSVGTLSENVFYRFTSTAMFVLTITGQAHSVRSDHRRRRRCRWEIVVVHREINPRFWPFTVIAADETAQCASKTRVQVVNLLYVSYLILISFDRRKSEQPRLK